MKIIKEANANDGFTFHVDIGDLIKKMPDVNMREMNINGKYVGKFDNFTKYKQLIKNFEKSLLDLIETY